METKWTEKHRLHLYQRLVQTFGAFNDRRYSPSNSKKFLVQIKKELKRMGLSTTEGGIKYQIAWATTKQKKVQPHHTKIWIQNVGAALEYGFINANDIPTGVSLREEKKA